MNGDHEQPRTLYVGNLSPMVGEDLLLTLFGQIGVCVSCKIIHEPGNDPYAFIEFADHTSAATALATMNKRNCYGKEMKVNWATTSGHQGKVDSSKHFHIFVGDLATEIDQQTLKEAFAPFGEISDVKIMKDPHTLSHKGYGFISFVNKVDAETAIASMNGQWLGTRKIRTNWATRKVQPGGESTMQIGGGGGGGMGGGAGGMGGGQMNAPMNPSGKFQPKLDFTEVWNRTGDSNSTVYVGGINGITEDLVRSAFAPYGQIIAVHAFADRGYAFVRFANKDQACNAICSAHGMDVNGCTAKCSWGKENIDITNQNAPQNAVNAYSQQLNAANALQAAASANPWNTAAAVAGNPTWNSAAAAANYQWTGYAQPNTINYWNSYPTNQYAAPMMQAQGWGVMPTAQATATSQQYAQMAQNPQGYNSKS